MESTTPRPEIQPDAIVSDNSSITEATPIGVAIGMDIDDDIVDYEAETPPTSPTRSVGDKMADMNVALTPSKRGGDEAVAQRTLVRVHQNTRARIRARGRK